MSSRRPPRILAVAAVVAAAAALAAWQVSVSWGSPVVRHRGHAATRGPATAPFPGRGRLAPFPGAGACAVGVADCSLRPCIVFVQGGGVAAAGSGSALLQVRPPVRPGPQSAQRCPLGDRGPGILPGSAVPVTARVPTAVRAP